MRAACLSTTFPTLRRRQRAIGRSGSQHRTPHCEWLEFPISLSTSLRRIRTMVSPALTVIAAARHFVRKSRFEHASKRSGSGTVSEGSRHLPARPVHARHSIPTFGIWKVELASSWVGLTVKITAKRLRGVEIHYAGPSTAIFSMIGLGRFCLTTSDDHVQIPDLAKNRGSEK